MTVGVGLLLLVPQVFYWGSQSPSLFTKAVYLHLCGAFACLMLALAWARDPRRAPLPRALVLPVLFVSYAAARGPWFAEARPEIGAPFLWGAILLVAWPTAAAAQAAPGAPARLGRLMVLLGGLTAAYALLQSLGVDLPLYNPSRRVLSASFTPGAWQPPFATLGNPNFLGEYLAGLLPLAVAGTLAATGSHKWLLGGAAAIMAGALPLTLARGAWLGAVAGLAVTFLACPPGKPGGRRLLLVALVMLASSLAAALAMGHWTRETSPWGKLLGTVYQLRAAGEGRRLWWGATLRMVADHPLAGVGEGRFREAYPAYQGLALASLPNPQTAAVAAATLESPHNDYLHVAAELGVPGLLLLLGVLGLILADGFRGAQRAEGPERAWRAGSLGGLAALLVAGLFGYPLHTPSGLFLASFLAALAVAGPPAEQSSRRAPRWQWILLVLVTALGFWQGAHLLRVYAASIHLHRGTEAFLRRDLPAAIEAFERAHEVSPRDSEVRVSLGQAYLAAGRPDMALPHFRAGLHGFDSARLRTLLARAYAAAGQAEAAEETFRVAVAWFPGGYAPLHLSYGAFLAGRGRDAEAARELTRALASDPNLADAHYLLALVRDRGGDTAGAAAALGRFLGLARPGDRRVEAAAARLREIQEAPWPVDNGKKPVK